MLELTISPMIVASNLSRLIKSERTFTNSDTMLTYYHPKNSSLPHYTTRIVKSFLTL